MGQAEVLDVLKKDKKKWWTTKEIKEELNHISIGSVGISINKLKNSNMVSHKLVEAKPGFYNGNRKYVLLLKWKN